MSSRWGCSLHLSSFYAANPPNTKPTAPHAQAHTHSSHRLFHPFIPTLSAREGRERRERGADVCGGVEGHVGRVPIAEVFDLINDTGLRCQPNRTLIKKKKVGGEGERGQLFHSLSGDISTRLLSIVCQRVTALVVEASRAAGGSLLVRPSPPTDAAASAKRQSSAITVLPPSFI